jgi:hypothetical protein
MITNRDPEFIGTITAIYREELGRDPEPAGLQGWLNACRNGMTGEQLRAAIHDSDEAAVYRSRPPTPAPTPIAALRAEGTNLLNEAGERVVMKGVDQFMALRMFMDGVDLTPLIDESHVLGFNMWRVFGQGSKAQNGILQLAPTEPNYYDTLSKFIELLNNKGIYVLFTVFVDNQDIHSDNGHWLRVADVVRGKGVFLSGGNEWSKNGFDPSTLPDPQVQFWSRGSDVEDKMPFAPVGTFMEFHPRRLWPTVMLDSVASPVEIYKHRPFIPLFIDEPPRMGQDGSGAEYADPTNCWRFARHYATEAAGAVFHSRSGQRGVPMDPLTLVCAQAWQRGMVI